MTVTTTKTEPINRAERRAKKILSRGVISAGLVLGGFLPAAVLLAPRADAAPTNCLSGVNSWGNGRVAWGACDAGSGMFRLNVSCTNGQSRNSAWTRAESGRARVDVSCPWPTVVRWTGVQTSG
jgi:hypothetical protein